MSLLQWNFRSIYLRGNTDVSIILPESQGEPEQFYEKGKKYKVLWLLHGTFGDHTDWVRYTNIERYACEHNLAVVMPSALNSMYGNWNSFAMGYDAFDYLIKELMPAVYAWFPISDRKEDNFIAGLSMGGRGACVYAFNHPELFAKAFVMSAVPEDLTDIDTKSPFYHRVENLIANYGGMEGYLNSELNLWKLAKERKDELPELYFTCGDQDPIAWKRYNQFKAYAEETGLKAVFDEVEGYSHEWPFWELSIQKAIKWFLNK